MSGPAPHLFAVAPLRRAMARVVAGFGAAPAVVAQVADNLVEANLAGHDSHGIGMLPRYAAAFLEGDLAPDAHVRIVHDGGTLLRLDGGGGFGQVLGQEAMALGIERARAHGCAVVALGGAHHLGRIGAWAEQAADAGLVSLHFVNVDARPIVAPFGGARAAFGTNPFTAGVPLPGRPPMILDFATSMIAQGKARVAHNEGHAVAPGCLIDAQGNDTVDPRHVVVEPVGALLPFGLHKGYGLAVLCELLGGALAAGMAGHRAPADRQRVRNGMLSILLAPGAVGDAEAFAAQARAFVDDLLAVPARPGGGPVQIAGDPERRTRAQRSAAGVPVDDATWQQILHAAARLGADAAAVDREARGG